MEHPKFAVMRPPNVLLLLMLLSVVDSFAQKQGRDRLDSLLTELPKTKDDTNKVILLIDLSKTAYPINSDNGIRYGNEALALAGQCHWEKGIADAENAIGTNYAYARSDYPEALEHFLKALTIYEQLNELHGMALVLSDIGSIHRYQSDFPKALEYNNKALGIAIKADDKKEQVEILGNIGLTYYYKSDTAKALKYLLGALAQAQEIGYTSHVARNLGNAGEIYKIQRNYSKALEFLFRALKLNEESGNRRLRGDNLWNIGTTYLSIAKDSLNPDARALLGKRFAGNKKVCLQQAKVCIDSAIASLAEIGNLSGEIDGYQSLSEVLVLLGDESGALKSYKNYAMLKDSVFSREKSMNISRMQTNYDQGKIDAAEQAELQKQKIIRNGFVGGFAVVLLFAGVFFRQRNKTKMEKKRSDDLLLNILPDEVATELKQTGHCKAKTFSMVTVMFADFKDFTRISEKVSAELLVDEINSCFSAFDIIVAKHNVEKIKTVGDAYICASGLPVSNFTHPFDMVNAALEIRNFMADRKKEKEAKEEVSFELRIGVHTGPVVAGIVGIKKFAYDIWGDTVNIAARMEQNAEAGKINISGTTYELVKDRFNCMHRGKIPAKNMGEIDMYFVEANSKSISSPGITRIKGMS